MTFGIKRLNVSWGLLEPTESWQDGENVLNHILALFIVASPMSAFRGFAAETAASVGNEQTSARDSAYASRAEQCGREKQEQCVPERQGGNHICGKAISLMVMCMVRGTKYQDKCKNGCGNGKDYIDCSNGFMTNCGYKKVPTNNSKLCTKPGAVRAYETTPTSMGKIYGHAEFVCGEGKYCSIYSDVFSAPWPKAEADGCWYPTDDNGILPFLGIGAAAVMGSALINHNNPSPTPRPTPTVPDILNPINLPTGGKGGEQSGGTRPTGPQILGTEYTRPPNQLGNLQVGNVNLPLTGNTNAPVDLPKDGKEPVVPRLETETPRPKAP